MSEFKGRITVGYKVDLLDLPAEIEAIADSSDSSAAK